MPSLHIRNNRLANGKCARCGSRPHLEGKTYCEPCLAKHKAYSKQHRRKYNTGYNSNINYRKKIIDKGLCLNCLEPILNKATGKLHCDSCISLIEEKKILKRKNPEIKFWDNQNNREIYVKENLIDKIIDKLTILDYSHLNGKSAHYWVCQCECGNIAIKSSQYLLNNRTNNVKNCGCQDG